MAGITARICGICPVSHLLASAKAGDQILAVRIPPAAEKLRRLMNLGPDRPVARPELLPPQRARTCCSAWTADPARRNVFGLIAADPELARGGIRLRQFGQEIIEALGGKKIHPAWSRPRRRARAADRRGPRPTSAAASPRRSATTQTRSALFKGLLDTLSTRRPRPSATSRRCSWAWSADDGDWEHYDGQLRFVDADGKIVADRLDPARYREYIGEAVEPDSYLKSPYYKPLGYPDGIYRVGPLARLNVCARMGTPLADRELAEFRQRGGRHGQRRRSSTTTPG